MATNTKKITDFLPRPEVKNTVSVQGYVDADLREKVIDQMKADKKAGIKMTWDNLIDASLRAYLAERAK